MSVHNGLKNLLKKYSLLIPFCVNAGYVDVLAVDGSMSIDTKHKANSFIFAANSHRDSVGGALGYKKDQTEIYAGFSTDKTAFIHTMYALKTVRAMADLEVVADSKNYTITVSYTHLFSDDWGVKFGTTQNGNITIGIRKWIK